MESENVVSFEDRVKEIAQGLKEEHPGMTFFQIAIPERDGEIFIGRRCSWNEYKRMLGTVKTEADANEILVQKFLVYPKPDFEAIQSEWDPGLVVTLAQQIQKGLGFTSGASVKKL